MPYSDFIECLVYEQLEPFGEKGAYLRAGILASLTANIHRDQKTRRDPFTPEDFIPSVDREEKEALAAAERMLHVMEVFAAANPGTIRFKPKKKHG